jgi:CMP-N-acetylneuraminic acid synthetase
MSVRPARRILALIPAKGASTRLKRKNVLPLGRKPLIAWTIEAAIAANAFDRIVVSTEDAEVAEISRAAGADVPFERPSELSVDPAGVVQVALHALDTLESAGDRYDEICIMLPTSPFRSPDDIMEALALFRRRKEPNLMSVARFEHTPFAALGIDDEGRIFPHFSDRFGRKSQELPAAYRPNGAIHILDVEWFRRTRSYLASPIIPYIMPRERSIDIDSAEDLREAEAMLAAGTVAGYARIDA